MQLSYHVLDKCYNVFPMVKIYTKGGDKGETGLLYGGRVTKTDPRCEAYGTTDEAVSALGLARAISKSDRVKNIVRQVQRDLFTVGAELATDPAEYTTMKSHFKSISSDSVEQLERIIDQLGADVRLPRSFIIPGASEASSALDLARAIIRRAERHVVGLKEKGLLVNEEVLRYLNRLADLLFMLARYEDRNMPLDALTDGV